MSSLVRVVGILTAAVLIVGGSALTVPLEARACLWDRDTLAIEMIGFEDIADASLGRFARNPPFYYEVRLNRVTEELAENPPDPLALMDDAAVACDRMGDSECALDFMARKRSLLDAPSGLPYSAEELATHEYRYLANLGTFHAHRALADNAPRGADMQRARELIAAAIELNPDAHFGREWVQLAIIDLLLADYNAGGNDARLLIGALFEEHGAARIAEGLAGLVILGNAWESPLVFELLATAAHAADRRTHLARLAELRTAELTGRSESVHHADSPPPMIHWSIEPREAAELRQYFDRARAAAELEHERRTAFMLAKLTISEHPDTHEDFWDGYVETPRPDPPGTYRRLWQWLVVWCFSSVIIGGSYILWKRPFA